MWTLWHNDYTHYVLNFKKVNPVNSLMIKLMYSIWLCSRYIHKQYAKINAPTTEMTCPVPISIFITYKILGTKLTIIYKIKIWNEQMHSHIEPIRYFYYSLIKILPIRHGNAALFPLRRITSFIIESKRVRTDERLNVFSISPHHEFYDCLSVRLPKEWELYTDW